MGDLHESIPEGVVSLPVIDLSLDRDQVSRAILDAGKNIGFFQVINHGVTEQAMRDMEAACREFFALPAEDKAAFYSEDNKKTNRYFSGSTYQTGGNKYWMDCLRLGCSIPVGDSKNNWPDKPQNLREVIETFTVLTRDMGMELLRLLCDGMGLRPDYFDGNLGGADVIVTLNHYPACPDPSTMIGLPPHCDRNLLSLLLPSTVPGLQFSHNGQWIDVQPLPNAFIVNFGLPLEAPLPEGMGFISLPVVDFSLSHEEISRAILDAGKDIGFFQVINHGVPEQVRRDMEAVCEEFFAMPAADRESFHSDDNLKPNRFFTGSTYKNSGAKFWFDCLRLSSTFPIGDSKKDWPEKPEKLREVFERFAVQTRGMGEQLLRLLSEGMGLQPDYFEGDLGRGNMNLTLNQYPPCGDPEGVGLPPHCDRNLLSLLIPSTVPGLQFSYKGSWFTVETMPNAYIVNFGLPLQVVTNGMLKSIEHRVVTNPKESRRSVGVFITPTWDCLISPAEEFLSKESPPIYHAVTYREFYDMHGVVKDGLSSVLTISHKTAI